MMTDAQIIEGLLAELRYVLETADGQEWNSKEIREQAATRLGYVDYAAFCLGHERAVERARTPQRRATASAGRHSPR